MMRKIVLMVALMAGLALGLGGTGGPGVADELPASRSFHMGFTPLPFDFTDAAFDETYDLINAHSDIIGHHLDEGVPWLEAQSGSAFAPNVQADLQRRLQSTKPGQSVFLSVTPLALTRQGLAQNWGSDSHMPNPEAFAGAPLDAPHVKQAFTAYALDMIRQFEPKYFAYAIEISDLTGVPEVRAQFVNLAAHVYTEVKAQHPDLKVFPTYTLGNGLYFEAGLADLMRELAPFTDVVAISTYPYVWDGVGGDAEGLPQDWFQKIADVLPDKPFAIAETGFIAGNFSKLSSLVWIRSNPESQATYVKRLIEDAQELNAQFVIWYVPRDYDALWEKMKANGMNGWFAQWMRAGLWDADGAGRPALEIWEAWRALPRSGE
ncbi:MAG: hypothetical protein ABJ251_23515 [Paracoccaceae bacterium]